MGLAKFDFFATLIRSISNTNIGQYFLPGRRATKKQPTAKAKDLIQVMLDIIGH